ncbi:MAG: enoyl-CoA hydratase-related protein [Bacteroidota bacterium]
MIDVVIQNRIATITLNRPEKRNALNNEMAARLLEIFQSLDTNNDCKVIVIKANGEAFCSGADLEYLQQLQSNTLADNLTDSTQLMNMFSTLYHLSKITIAQVEGPAIAGGCGLAGLCDFCYATPEATFGYTEVKIGFIPAIVSVFLTRRIGENAARQLLLTGDIIDAQRAFDIQLITKMVNKAEISDVVARFADKLIKTVSGESIAQTKALLAAFPGLSIKEQLNLAAKANAEARGTNDCKKGISSFLNKEKIVW